MPNFPEKKLKTYVGEISETVLTWLEKHDYDASELKIDVKGDLFVVDENGMPVLVAKANE